MNITASRPLAASDTSIDNFSWFLVTGTAGAVTYVSTGGNVTVLPAVPVGVWMPVANAVRITTASTATGFIVA